MHQISPFSSLCSITWHKDIALRHDLPQSLSHFRVSCTDNCPDIAVVITHMLFSPSGYLLSNDFIKRPVICVCKLSVLKLSTAWIRRLDQNEKAFLFFLTYFDKRLDTI